jgi:hypothetical protein
MCTVAAASGGGQRPSLAHYVTEMGPMDGATAAGGRSCCLPSGSAGVAPGQATRVVLRRAPSALDKATTRGAASGRQFAALQRPRATASHTALLNHSRVEVGMKRSAWLGFANEHVAPSSAAAPLGPRAVPSLPREGEDR